MKPLVLTCAGIILVVAIYLISGAGGCDDALSRPAKVEKIEPVEAVAEEWIGVTDSESDTKGSDRELGHMPSGTATANGDLGRSSSLPATKPGLGEDRLALDDELEQEAIGPPNSNDEVRLVPRNWSLGSPSVAASAGLFYQLESDFETVLDGTASVSITSVQPVEPRWTAGIVQIVDAEVFRDQRISYTGFLRTQSLSSDTLTSAMLWFRADDETGRVVAFQNTISQFVPQNETWSEATIIIDIPATASSISYGASLIGNGTAWVDRLSVELVDLTYPTTSPPYDRQTFNRVPNPKNVLKVPSNLGFELVIPHP